MNSRLGIDNFSFTAWVSVESRAGKHIIQSFTVGVGLIEQSIHNIPLSSVPLSSRTWTTNTTPFFAFHVFLRRLSLDLYVQVARIGTAQVEILLLVTVAL